VARDRQRAKQRRAQRRRSGAGAPDTSGSGAGAPDPLDHASADVDEARLAEAGALPPELEEGDDAGAQIYEDELERAPDAVEGDAISRRDVEHAEHPPRKRGRVLTFLGHCVDELRRVQWPNRRQVGQATAVVLGFVVIAGGYLGLLDQLWQPLIEAIL
jgi:preprotein translocase subunit SecE